MSLKDRLEKLEQKVEDSRPKQFWFILRYNGEPAMSRAEIERKKAEYKKAHPDWEKRLFNLIRPDE